MTECTPLTTVRTGLARLNGTDRYLAVRNPSFQLLFTPIGTFHTRMNRLWIYLRIGHPMNNINAPILIFRRTAFHPTPRLSPIQLSLTPVMSDLLLTHLPNSVIKFQMMQCTEFAKVNLFTQVNMPLYMVLVRKCRVL